MRQETYKYRKQSQHRINKIHKWLRRKYGKAYRCSFDTCRGISKRFEWALRKGRKYERTPYNFIMLCKSCHRTYDINKRWNRNLAASHRMRKGLGIYPPPWNKGIKTKPHTEKTRKIMSEVRKKALAKLSKTERDMVKKNISIGLKNRRAKYLGLS